MKENKNKVLTVKFSGLTSNKFDPSHFFKCIFLFLNIHSALVGVRKSTAVAELLWNKYEDGYP